MKSGDAKGSFMVVRDGLFGSKGIWGVAKKLIAAREAGMFLVMIALMAVLAIIAPRFMTLDNLLNVGRQTALTGIMAVGMGLVMITGNFDLSIGSTYGLSALLTALVLVKTGNTALALFLGLMVGFVVGVINGFLTVKVRMPAFVATFGMMNVCRGIALILTLGYPVTLSIEGITSKTNPLFFFLGQGTIFNKVPMQLVFMAAAMLIVGYILHRTIWGLHVFAVGGSEKASFASGINVRMVRFKTFVICGVGASLAGILNLSFIGGILPIAGQGLEFQVFAAIVIGGTSLSGGEGSILGILVGALVLGIINNGLVLMGVDPFWQILIIGIITISAVAYDTLTWQSRLQRRIATK